MATKAAMEIYFGGKCEITEGLGSVKIKKKGFVPYSSSYLRNFVNEVKPVGLKVIVEVLLPFKFFGREIVLQRRVL